MQKNLVIVESPAKAKTIEKFLGKDYRVMSSYGHIRDLSTKELGIDVAHDFKPQYVVPEEKKKLVAELKKASQDAREVLLASDEDREGEAIAWHLSEALELSPDRTQRIVFHEITKPASTRREASTSTSSMPNRRGVCWIVSWALNSRRCCGARSSRRCRPDVCSRWLCD